MIVIQFIIWSLVLYICHRLAHSSSWLWQYHRDHHEQISDQTNKGHHWTNYLLFFDSWKSTMDQWLIEIIPTIIVCVIFWDVTLFVFYYFWAVLIQERIEHNPNFDIYPILTSGKWHLIHHSNYDKNYGVFISLWDKIFKTYKAKL